MRFWISCLLMLASPLAAETQTYRFVWQGAGDYEMHGALSFDTREVIGAMVTENEVQCFEINGFHQGDPVGRWALGQWTETTTWRLHFVPDLSAFVPFGFFIEQPQAWNMNGYGDNCGDAGFGFNIGSQAQDICIDNRLIWESQITPERPFPAQRDDGYEFGPEACRPMMLLGALQP
jgi:hypothetical protein